jgi:hypothetical protein
MEGVEERNRLDEVNEAFLKALPPCYNIKLQNLSDI